MLELSKQFRFDAAHTLDREIQAESSRRIHGHSYRAEITIRGWPDPRTGMILDLGEFERALEGARDALDHRFLDEINDLGPATMENLCLWIWRRLKPDIVALARVAVHRDSSGETCTFDGVEG
ncbi:6-carboxytetrahydropterin synthase [Sphingomonas koreensis]|uniref:6-carboxy-5,6,7,8-tetrahydropterin synthase n=1 Tax=Sphingomonas koreensis TaxID=93064 RepID=A0A1L6J8I0_9SPHN|nr:6-carboxytetrahydropterin synthase [Sphingomonas koreensis]APR52136.1 6-carboxytetrahydropterin synthase QueD [Sphingomonas koreensis]RSU22945.1 6-carboxytetrahydropterin synthase [Sphingomonas koreensis]RSU26810.1 6-carboxytetrahydropterin synthase [Sphingomonas koreensis]RSU30581.1 6-carboxytetrahydropterin synthase [Sphingomonas koreensis]RSU36946.1 6-carboxytetrahydropterin synthase [Sphingomonas koreensis]